MGKTNRREKTFRDGEDQYYEYNRPKKAKDQRKRADFLRGLEDWNDSLEEEDWFDDRKVKNGKRVRS